VADRLAGARRASFIARERELALFRSALDEPTPPCTVLYVWASLTRIRARCPTGPSALYFSAVTCTTTGYGDLVLPADWPLAGAVEALTGIPMCWWSTGFFFAIVSRMFGGGRDGERS
jgi:hypothetical protein